MMAAAPQRALTVVRDALNDLALLTPDEIAHKLAVEGMLWCDPRHRASSCPIHHYLTARLRAHGLEGIALSVSPDAVMAIVRGRNKPIMQPLPKPVSNFVYKFDFGDYEHLEGGDDER